MTFIYFLLSFIVISGIFGYFGSLAKMILLTFSAHHDMFKNTFKPHLDGKEGDIDVFDMDDHSPNSR